MRTPAGRWPGGLAALWRRVRGGREQARTRERAQLLAENERRAASLRERERQLAEERERLRRVVTPVSEVLAGMSHEIRTPLNRVMGTTRLLLDTRLDRDQREYAEVIRESSRALLDVVNDVLDLSKIEAGRLDLERVDFDLAAVVEGAVVTFAQRAASKGLELAVAVEAALPRQLRGDPGRLAQVLSNLLANAVESTEAGEVITRVTLAEESPDAVVVRFAVSDTGGDIPPEVRPRLFPPSIQADASAARRYGGTGLGLAISKRLAERMGGGMGAESAPGRGRTFWFTARLALTPGAAPAAGDEPVESPPSALPPDAPVVLVVEDNAINRAVAVRSLERLGYRADAARNGAEAVEKFAPEAYAAVLMDCQMPVMDGYEATARLREREAGVGHTPILAMTAGAMAGERERCLSAGMDDYITTPVAFEGLAAALARWVPREVRRPAPEPPASPLDARILSELRALDTPGSGFLQGVIALFLGTVPARLDSLAAAVRAGSVEGIRSVAHGLKSTCGNVGARRMQELAAEIERRAEAGAGAVEPLVRVLRDEYEDVRQALEAEQRSVPPSGAG